MAPVACISSHRSFPSARPFADAGKHGDAAVAAAGGMNQLLQQDRLADSRAADQACLAASSQRRQQIDGLDAGFEQFQAGTLLGQRRRFAMNRPILHAAWRRQTVERLAERIEQSAERRLADGGQNRPARSLNVHAPAETFRVVHGNRANCVRIQMMGDFEDCCSAAVFDPQCLIDGRQFAGKFGLDHRAANGSHPAACFGYRKRLPSGHRHCPLRKMISYYPVSNWASVFSADEPWQLCRQAYRLSLPRKDGRFFDRAGLVPMGRKSRATLPGGTGNRSDGRSRDACRRHGTSHPRASPN